MSDIVRRLREPPFGTETSERNLMNAAADEITRLRNEVQTARATALEEAARVVTEHYETLCVEHRLLLVNRAAAIRALIHKEIKN